MARSIEPTRWSNQSAERVDGSIGPTVSTGVGAVDLVYCQIGLDRNNPVNLEKKFTYIRYIHKNINENKSFYYGQENGAKADFEKFLK